MIKVLQVNDFIPGNYKPDRLFIIMLIVSNKSKYSIVLWEIFRLESVLDHVETGWVE